MSKPLRLYDIDTDGWRQPTQADLDNYMALNRAYGRILDAYKRGLDLPSAIKAANDELMSDYKVPS